MITDPSALVSGFNYSNLTVAVTNATNGNLLLAADPYRVYFGIEWQTTATCQLYLTNASLNACWNFSNLQRIEFDFRKHGGLLQAAWQCRDTAPGGGVARMFIVRYIPDQLQALPIDNDYLAE